MRDLRRMIGGDGLLTLALANGLLVLSGGLALALPLIEVHRAARAAPTEVGGSEPAALIMVLGRRLRRGRLTAEFARRLDRAASLFGAAPERPILVVGGGRRSGAVSEAEAGRRRLADRGIPEAAILTEETSRHTLENLCLARAAVRQLADAPFILVTSRYHLARSVAFAAGLGLRPLACAAEERWTLDAATLARMLREAYFLHWYRVGRAWARLTGNRRGLARIT